MTDWLVGCLHGWTQLHLPNTLHGEFGLISWAKELILSYLISINFQVEGMAYHEKQTLLSLRAFPGFRGYLPGARDKSQISLWVRPTSLLHRYQSGVGGGRRPPQLCLESFLGAEQSKQQGPEVWVGNDNVSWGKSVECLLSPFRTSWFPRT